MSDLSRRAAELLRRSEDDEYIDTGEAVALLRETAEQYEETLTLARDRVERDTLDEGFANEYLRGMVTLIADLHPTFEMDTGERMDEVLADLRAMTCRACSAPLRWLNGEILVAIRQAAPANAPAHDACCDDGSAMRCGNTACTHFAHPVSLPSDSAGSHAERLEYLRGELRAERISYGELIELQGLAHLIAPDDVELLEPAGVPEHATWTITGVDDLDFDSYWSAVEHLNGLASEYERAGWNVEYGLASRDNLAAFRAVRGFDDRTIGVERDEA